MSPPHSSIPAAMQSVRTPVGQPRACFRIEIGEPLTRPSATLSMNLPKDLGRTKRFSRPFLHLCPSQIFGAFFRRFSGSIREVLDRGILSASDGVRGFSEINFAKS